MCQKGATRKGGRMNGAPAQWGTCSGRDAATAGTGRGVTSPIVLTLGTFSDPKSEPVACSHNVEGRNSGSTNQTDLPQDKLVLSQLNRPTSRHNYNFHLTGVYFGQFPGRTNSYLLHLPSHRCLLRSVPRQDKLVLSQLNRPTSRNSYNFHLTGDKLVLSQLTRPTSRNSYTFRLTGVYFGQFPGRTYSYLLHLPSHRCLLRSVPRQDKLVLSQLTRPTSRNSYTFRLTGVYFGQFPGRTNSYLLHLPSHRCLLRSVPRQDKLVLSQLNRPTSRNSYTFRLTGVYFGQFPGRTNSYLLHLPSHRCLLRSVPRQDKLVLSQLTRLTSRNSYTFRLTGVYFDLPPVTIHLPSHRCLLRSVPRQDKLVLSQLTRPTSRNSYTFRLNGVYFGQFPGMTNSYLVN
ncbi:hypothetical protein J6590_015429 [Homalodisca vitripennis]|nr:hypothetical protein J6590_015429 [Homalodisca vitripennis]